MKSNAITYLVLFLLFCSSTSKGQDHTMLNDSSLLDNELKKNNYQQYKFDNKLKMPTTDYEVKNLGIFAIYFYPKSQTSKNRYLKFNTTNHFHPEVSKTDSYTYYNKQDEIKLNKILGSDIKLHSKDFLKIIFFIPSKFYEHIANGKNKDDGEINVSYPINRICYIVNEELTYRIVGVERIENDKSYTINITRL